MFVHNALHKAYCRIFHRRHIAACDSYEVEADEVQRYINDIGTKCVLLILEHEENIVAKEHFGAARTAKEIAEAKKHSNAGGERAHGMLFQHFLMGKKKHSARYLQKGNALVCSVCDAAV
jgi:hypothetical protein